MAGIYLQLLHPYLGRLFLYLTCVFQTPLVAVAEQLSTSLVLGYHSFREVHLSTHCVPRDVETFPTPLFAFNFPFVFNRLNLACICWGIFGIVGFVDVTLFSSCPFCALP
jgi:hypothetical protein